MQHFIDSWLPHAYASVFDREALQHALKQLADEYQSHVIGLIHQGEDQEVIFLNEGLAEISATYPDIENEWVKRSLTRMMQGDIVFDHELLTLSELKRTDFYHQFLKPLDVGHSLGFITHQNHKHFSCFTFSRSEQAGVYSPEEAQAIQMLRPHLQSIISMHLRISEQHGVTQSLQAMLDQQSHACFLLDQDRTPLYQNAMAETLLQNNQCVRLTSQGKLRLIDDEANIQFRRMIAAGVTHCSGIHQKASCQCRAQFKLARLHPEQSMFVKASLARYMLDIIPIDRAVQANTQELVKLFGLTHAEAELAAALVQTCDLRAAAEQRFISYETARGYLKKILRKSQTNNQAELLSLLTKISL